MARLAAYEDYRRQMHLRWLDMACAQGAEVANALVAQGLRLDKLALQEGRQRCCADLRAQLTGLQGHSERFDDQVRARMLLVNLTEWLMLRADNDLDLASGAIVQEMDRSYTSMTPARAIEEIERAQGDDQVFSALACLARAVQYDAENLLRMYFGKCMLCGTISRRVHRSVYHPVMWAEWEQEFLDLSAASRHCSLHDAPEEFASCMSRCLTVPAQA